MRKAASKLARHEAGGAGRFSALQENIPMIVEAIEEDLLSRIAQCIDAGGDLLQEVWCQYLRGGYSCWRNGGIYVMGPSADNSYYHSAMGETFSVNAVYPGVRRHRAEFLSMPAAKLATLREV